MQNRVENIGSAYYYSCKQNINGGRGHVFENSQPIALEQQEFSFIMSRDLPKIVKEQCDSLAWEVKRLLS